MDYMCEILASIQYALFVFLSAV